MKAVSAMRASRAKGSLGGGAGLVVGVLAAAAGAGLGTALRTAKRVLHLVQRTLTPLGLIFSSARWNRALHFGQETTTLRPPATIQRCHAL